MTFKKQALPRAIRWLALAASTAFFLFFSRFISEHAICPIGGFELFFNGFFISGFSLAGLFSGMVVTFLVMSVLSIIFRRAYCGYICPIGALQELFERIGKVALPKKLRGLKLPAKLDRVLCWGKYLMLALFFAGCAVWGGHWMIPGDIFMVFMGLGNPAGYAGLVQRLPYAVLFFAAVLLFSLFLGRGFCRYLCPAGGWFAALSLLSPNKVKRDESKCVSCGLCSKACPMNIDVAKAKTVSSPECIGCRECVNVCPKEGALSAPLGRIPLNSVVVPVATAAVFAGALYVAASSMPARGGRPGGAPNGAPGGEGGAEGGQFQGGKGGGQFQGGKGGGQSGQWQGKKGGQRPAQGAQADEQGQGQDQPKTVGFGGCSACIACGFCVSASRS